MRNVTARAVACPVFKDSVPFKVQIRESQLAWFALQVKAQREKHVSETLHEKGYEQFLPLYRQTRKWADRWKQVTLPLFPGYVFCRFDPGERLPILLTPGVLSVVRCGQWLAPIDSNEIRALQLAVDARLSLEPSSWLSDGERVTISAGPLKGVRAKGMREALFEAKKSLRLALPVTLLQRSVMVEIDRSWVTQDG